jgi:serine/threonine protein phosphatase PrpC
MSELCAVGISDVGCIRTNNEDRILVETDRGVFIVADGMGGEQCGEVAAELAVQTAGDYFLSPQPDSDAEAWPFEYDFTLDTDQNRVMNGVRLANRRVWESCQERRDCAGMGTTMSAMICHGRTATIGNIGDSRVYVFRTAQLRLLTRDDAIVADMVEAGEISVEEARFHPMRNVLTCALGRDEDVAVQLIQLALKPGDRLLLSTDGMHGVVEPTLIAQLLGEYGDPSDAAVQLVVAAKEAGGPDNISCIVVDFSGANSG